MVETKDLPPSVRRAIREAKPTTPVVVRGGKVVSGRTRTISEVLKEKALETPIEEKKVTTAEDIQKSLFERMGLRVRTEKGKVLARGPGRAIEVVGEKVTEIRGPPSAILRPEVVPGVLATARRRIEDATRAIRSDDILATRRRVGISKADKKTREEMFFETRRAIGETALPSIRRVGEEIKGLVRFPISFVRGAGKLTFAPTQTGIPPKIQIGQERIVSIEGKPISDPDIQLFLGGVAFSLAPGIVQKVAAPLIAGERITRAIKEPEPGAIGESLFLSFGATQILPIRTIARKIKTRRFEAKIKPKPAEITPFLLESAKKPEIILIQDVSIIPQGAQLTLKKFVGEFQKPPTPKTEFFRTPRIIQEKLPRKEVIDLIARKVPPTRRLVTEFGVPVRPRPTEQLKFRFPEKERLTIVERLAQVEKQIPKGEPRGLALKRFFASKRGQLLLERPQFKIPDLLKEAKRFIETPDILRPSSTRLPLFFPFSIADTRTRLSIISPSELVPKVDIVSKLLPAQEIISVSAITPITGAISFLGADVVSAQRVEVVSAQELLSAQQQVARQETRLKAKQRLKFKPKVTTKPVVRGRQVKKKKIPVENGRVQGYNVLVKNPLLKVGKKRISRGFSKANVKPLPKAAATNLGAKIVDKFSNRSFTIKRSGNLVKKARRQVLNTRLLSKFRTSKKDSRIFVEKSMFAIDSFQEKKSIPFRAQKLRKLGLIKSKPRKRK